MPFSICLAVYQRQKLLRTKLTLPLIKQDTYLTKLQRFLTSFIKKCSASLKCKMKSIFEYGCILCFCVGEHSFRVRIKHNLWEGWTWDGVVWEWVSRLHIITPQIIPSEDVILSSNSEFWGMDPSGMKVNNKTMHCWKFEGWWCI